MRYYIFSQNVLFHAWTDNEYIMCEYLKLDIYHQYIAEEFTGTYQEFCEHLEKDYGVSYMAPYKLQILYGRGISKYTIIASNDMIETLLYESGVVDTASFNLILSLYKLKRMSKYVLDERMRFYLEYIFRRYILDLIDYVRGVDESSDRFDPIYILQLERYLGVMNIERDAEKH